MGEYAVPTLPSGDLRETLSFYERLGFANAGDAPEVWDYAIVRRGSIELHFYLDGGGTPSGCFAWVDDVDAFHDELSLAGVLHDPPVDADYGVRLVAVIDPDGNRITFGTGPH